MRIKCKIDGDRAIGNGNAQPARRGEREIGKPKQTREEIINHFLGHYESPTSREVRGRGQKKFHLSVSIAQVPRDVLSRNCNSLATLLNNKRALRHRRRCDGWEKSPEYDEISFAQNCFPRTRQYTIFLSRVASLIPALKHEFWIWPAVFRASRVLSLDK